mmetsp:Transcript_17046/g.50882  ORF Transcript_17046/g.50882 Transcript_17046/m.50882 type:complete len:402 (-) Transcript_17046:511-1716(-)
MPLHPRAADGKEEPPNVATKSEAKLQVQPQPQLQRTTVGNSGCAMWKGNNAAGKPGCAMWKLGAMASGDAVIPQPKLQQTTVKQQKALATPGYAMWQSGDAAGKPGYATWTPRSAAERDLIQQQQEALGNPGYAMWQAGVAAGKPGYANWTRNYAPESDVVTPQQQQKAIGIMGYATWQPGDAVGKPGHAMWSQAGAAESEVAASLQPRSLALRKAGSEPVDAAGKLGAAADTSAVPLQPPLQQLAAGNPGGATWGWGNNAAGRPGCATWKVAAMAGHDAVLPRPPLKHTAAGGPGHVTWESNHCVGKIGSATWRAPSAADQVQHAAGKLWDAAPSGTLPPVQSKHMAAGALGETAVRSDDAVERIDADRSGLVAERPQSLLQQIAGVVVQLARRVMSLLW